ncbi:MAG: PAS domain S-box protein [Deltaproteobacteria bacterium]|nr:PAS domain S-box protein [Deltaproteobacteria bacterium]
MTDRQGWYERVFEHSLDGVVISRPDGTILRANPAACRIVGRSEAEIIRGGRQALIADDAGVKAAFARRRATGFAAGEGLITLPDGKALPVEFSTGLLPSTPDDGEIGYAIFRDVSERRRADEQLRRATRALRLLARCHHAAACATTEHELFAAVCDAVVEVGGYRMCWVGLAEQDPAGTLRQAAHAGHEDGYLAEAGIVWADVPRGQCPCGTAARTGTPVAGSDFANDAQLAPWKTAAAARGYRSVMALPLFHGGERIGVLGAYSTRNERLDDEELGILMQLAQEVARAAWAFRAGRARDVAEHALYLNEERLKEAQRNAHIGSWLYVPGQPFIWSDETYDLYELPRGAPPTIEAVRAVIHPEDRNGKLAGVFERALASNVTDLHFEFRVLRPNGQVRWLQAIGKVRRAPDGSPIDATGTVQDVTDLKEASLLAQRAATRLATLADASRAFAEVAHDERALLDEVARRVCDALADSCEVLLVSDDGQWVRQASLYCSDATVADEVRRANGLTPEPIDGNRNARVIRENQSILLPTITLELVKATTPPDCWPLYERTTPHSAIVAPLRVQGRCIGCIGLVRFRKEQPSYTPDDLSLAQDLADRAALAITNAHLLDQVQRELAERNRAVAESNRLAAVLEQATEMVVVTDEHEVIEYVNPTFEEITGYRRDEAIGRTPDFLRSGAGEDEYQAMRSAVERGEQWRGRLTTRRKDGTNFVEDAIVAPFRDEHDKLVGYFRLKRDVTRDLLLQAQLLQAQKMEGIGRLAGGVAHDFNNLLSVILGCARFAIEDLKPGDPLREDLMDIERAGERGALLTRQLLAFSRRQVLKAEPLELNRVIGDMHKMLQRILGEDIELVEALAPRLGTVKADAGQMEQVVMNLAVNARDAMPKGGKLTIATEDVDIDAEFAAARGDLLPGPHVRVSVTDTGIGMDVKTQARIFEPFFTTKEPGKGTGLGLSTVYGIVTQSGGRVHVYSELGHGTTFSVYLPRIDAPPAAPRTALPSTRPRGVETVLVVEDDQAVRKIVRRVLENAGYKVLAAANGGEGLLLCEQHEGTIHLVLSDVVMPMMSGPDFVERARKVRPQLKALFMSGYTDDAIVRHGLLDGDVDFVNKPLSQGELLKRVREAIDRPVAAPAQ